MTGRLSDLLQLPGATVAPLTDQDGEPAGAVVLAPPDTRLLGVVTRALPPLDGDAALRVHPGRAARSASRSAT